MCAEQLTREWKNCKNILCIRADNMGDLLMSSPAMRALKETFDCKLTVLTSSAASSLVKMLPFIDDSIIFDLPWIKSDKENSESIFQIAKQLRQYEFDAAVIFTTFSQNPLPAAMLAYMAEIPNRLAYCRENPYALLTHWMPEKEPYCFIRHQVERDLDLVASINAFASCDDMQLEIPPDATIRANRKLMSKGIDLKLPWMIMHAPVSEKKREYPAELWIEAGAEIAKGLNMQILLTGTARERCLTDFIAKGIGSPAFSIAGLLTLDEFAATIRQTSIVVSVNTGTVHLAAAVKTPVIVLYALTNPQHTPWKVPHQVLSFEVAPHLRSKNEVIQFLHHEVMKQHQPMPQPADIFHAAKKLLVNRQAASSFEFCLAGC